MIPKFVSIFSKIAAGFKRQLCTNAHYIYHGFIPTNNISVRRNYGDCVQVPPINTDPVIKDTKEHSCKQFTTVAKIFNCVCPKTSTVENKVSVIGLDDMGIATVFALLAKEITSNICMIDINDEILQGEHSDIQSSALFLKNPKIISSKDPEATRDSKVCVITTGTYRGRDEVEADYVARNAGIIRAIVPPLVKYSPDTLFIVASEPVDVLSYVTWKLAGVPKHRVIGTGTMLDTARFRYMLAEKFGVSPECCHAQIIGQHGDNSVPVWSNANIGGVRIQDVNPQVGTDNDPEMWNDLYKIAVTSDKLVRELKGSVSWSMALVIAEICKAVFTNSNTVTPVSTYAKGEHSIRDEVFVSLPCVLGKSGITHIVRQTLTDTESSLLRRGSEIIAQLQENTKKILS